MFSVVFVNGFCCVVALKFCQKSRHFALLLVCSHSFGFENFQVLSINYGDEVNGS